MIKYSPLLASIVWGASSLGLATGAAAQTEPTHLADRRGGANVRPGLHGWHQA
jgi:hypothetical protein